MENNTFPNETNESEKEKMSSFFQKYKEVAVAFSGGVDSAVLLLLANKYAKRTKAYFVKSQFQPESELNDAIRIAEMIGVEIEVINVDVLSFDIIIANPENRCYYCKKVIFERIIKYAVKDGFGVILDGTNASDDTGDRPGFRALQELDILSPLKIFGYKKKQIRQLAKQYRIPVADKPSYACLATRIPSGTYITKELLSLTEAAENELKELGFVNFRLRYLDGTAKLELGKNEKVLLNEKKDQISAVLSKYYKDYYVDSKERADE